MTGGGGAIGWETDGTAGVGLPIGDGMPGCGIMPPLGSRIEPVRRADDPAPPIPSPAAPVPGRSTAVGA